MPRFLSAAGLLLLVNHHGALGQVDRERELDRLMQQMLGGAPAGNAQPASQNPPNWNLGNAKQPVGSDDAAVTAAVTNAEIQGADVPLQSGFGLMTQTGVESSHHAREKRLDELMNQLMQQTPDIYPSTPAPAPRALDPIAADLAAPIDFQKEAEAAQKQQDAVDAKVDAEIDKVTQIIQGALHHDPAAVQQQREKEFYDLAGTKPKHPSAFAPSGPSGPFTGVSQLTQGISKAVDQSEEAMQNAIWHALDPAAGALREGAQEVQKIEDTIEKDLDVFPGSDLERSHGRTLTFMLIILIVCGYFAKYTDVPEKLWQKFGVFIKPNLESGSVLSEFELAGGRPMGLGTSARAAAGRPMRPWRPTFGASNDIDQLL